MRSMLGITPTLVGFSSVVLVVPICTIFGTFADRIRKGLITRTDARVEAMSEALTSALYTLCADSGLVILGDKQLR